MMMMTVLSYHVVSHIRLDRLTNCNPLQFTNINVHPVAEMKEDSYVRDAWCAKLTKCESVAIFV